MLRLLADANAEAHVAALVRSASRGYWRDVWLGMDVEVNRLRDVGLRFDTPDDEIWRFCQQGGYLLLTANRNGDGPTSLDAVVRDRNDVASLPVLTFADANRVLRDGAYRDAVVDKVMEVLVGLDLLRGSGRLYVP